MLILFMGTAAMAFSSMLALAAAVRASSFTRASFRAKYWLYTSASRSELWAAGWEVSAVFPAGRADACPACGAAGLSAGLPAVTGSLWLGCGLAALVVFACVAVWPACGSEYLASTFFAVDAMCPACGLVFGVAVVLCV